MQATSYAKQELEQVFDFMGACLQEVTDDQYNWKPAGTCNPIAKLHAHALSAVDFFVNFLLRGNARMWPEIAAKTGLPANSLEIWQADVRLPRAEMQAYATRLRDSVSAYVASLSDGDLDRQVETRIMGRQTAGWILQLAASHTASHTGEISAVKGMQGLKGLPF